MRRHNVSNVSSDGGAHKYRVGRALASARGGQTWPLGIVPMRNAPPGRATGRPVAPVRVFAALSTAVRCTQTCGAER